MFVEDDSARGTVEAGRLGGLVDQVEEHLAYLRRREDYLQRLAVAALNALMAVDLDAFNELVKRAESWT